MSAEVFARDLIGALGPQRVRLDLRDRLAYAYDATGEKHLPDVVVFPESTGEVSACLRLAGYHGVPVIPRGAGTNLSGGTLPVAGGVVVNMVRMNRIRRIDPAARLAVAEAGVVNGALQQAVAPHGLFFAPDPSSLKVSTLGGNLAENAGGPRCAKYGVTANHVLGVEMVLADGEVVALGGEMEDPPGLDLLGLAIGAEGTLGIITAATLRLTPLPAAYRTMLAVFDRLPDAMAAVSGIVASRIIPAALELLDENTMAAVRRSSPGAFAEGAAVLLIEVDGDPGDLSHQVARIDQVVRQHGAREVRLAGTEAERAGLWAARRAAYPALAQVSPAVWAMDVTVPRDRLVQMLDEILKLSERHRLKVYTVAHAGDGNMHPTIPFNPADQEERRRLDLLNHDIQAACVALGGSITGEHGAGIEKLSGMSIQYEPGVLAWMQAVRRTFDPALILNPGKAIPAEANGRPPVVVVGPDLRPENLSGSFPAGEPLSAVHAQLEAAGLWLPLEHCEEPDATLGDCLAGGFANPLRLGYGTPRDWVLGLEVDTARGVMHFGGEVVKNVAGYDLVKLHLGARGRFGQITRATLRLLPLPESSCTVTQEFATPEATEAAVRAALASGARPAALELIGRPGSLQLLARLVGDRSTLPARAEAVAAAFQGGKTLPDAECVWQEYGARRAALAGRYAWRHKFSVPAPRVAAALRELAGAINTGDWSVAGHAGSGVFTVWWNDPAGPAAVTARLSPPQPSRTRDRLEAALVGALGVAAR